MSDDTTTAAPRVPRAPPVTRPVWALVVLWLDGAPERVGEVALLPDGPSILGRGEALPTDPAERVLPGRHLPGRAPVGEPIAAPAVSRVQLALTPSGAAHVAVTRVGRCPLWVDGREVDEAVARPGSILELQGQALFLVCRRVPRFEARAADHAFGRPDAWGLVGESPIAWALRARVAFAAARPAHVLITGPSGVGKELVARALHAASARGRRELIARNAATLPEGLVDAELFGNVAHYPNQGVRERPGLVGRADGSTLFLDEIGELPEETQAHLLRVLDDGEYHRLGDARPRRADLRLVAATNRDPDTLKHDLLARLALRIDVPGLDAHIEDVPLIASELLRRIGREDPQAVACFFPHGDVSGHARVTPRLVRTLVQHTYTAHVRELLGLLWRAIEQSPGPVLDLHVATAAPTATEPRRRPEDVTRDEIARALRDHDGAIRKTAEALGLSSRHALARLMKKHGLS